MVRTPPALLTPPHPPALLTPPHPPPLLSPPHPPPLLTPSHPPALLTLLILQLSPLLTLLLSSPFPHPPALTSPHPSALPTLQLSSGPFTLQLSTIITLQLSSPLLTLQLSPSGSPGACKAGVQRASCLLTRLFLALKGQGRNASRIRIRGTREWAGEQPQQTIR